MSTDSRTARHASAPAATPATPPVPEPTGAPPAVLPALLVGLVVLALGVAAVRDAVVTLGWVSGSPWSTPVLDALDAGVTRSPVVVVVGVVVALVGLWVLLRAVSRRPRTEVSLGEGIHAWLAPQHVARVAALTASDVDGVVSARARPGRGRRALTVRVVATEPAAAAVKASVRTAVDEALAGLDPTPRVRVRVSTLGGSR